MKTIQKIIINRPVDVVFEFSINPNNTDKWFVGTGIETASEFPPKIGTVYENQFGILRVTNFEKNKTFQLSKENSDYNVRYEYISINDKTELTYIEWGNDLTCATTDEPFKKLKELLEKPIPNHQGA